MYVDGKGTEVSAVIAGCDWDVGLTVQSVQEKRYLICTNGPASPVYKGMSPHKQTEELQAHKKFLSYVWTQMAANKPLVFSELNILEEAVMGRSLSRCGGPTTEDCAFSQ